MLNNVHSCAPMLAALWQSVASGWARAGGGGLRAGALEAALQPLGRSAREVASFAATRLIFYELRAPLLGELYARSVDEPPEQMAALLPLLAERVSGMVRLVLRVRARVHPHPNPSHNPSPDPNPSPNPSPTPDPIPDQVRLVLPELAAEIAVAVLRAALAAFEYVLLEGGARTFVARDAPTLEEELQAPLDL